MAMFTYITENEERTYSAVVDSDVNELFQEVRKKIGKNYFLKESVSVRKVGLIKRKKYYTHSYTLYISNGHLPEVQVFNWPPMKGTWSINGSAPKSMVICFFLGLLNGVKIATIHDTPHQ